MSESIKPTRTMDTAPTPIRFSGAHRLLTLGLAALVLLLLFLLVLSRNGSPPLEDAQRRDRKTNGVYDARGRAIQPLKLPASRPNLVLIVVDTLRADTARDEMPFVGELAARGVSFEGASSPAPWTKPAMASLLTGLYPSEHGAIDARHPPFLPAAIPTFAEILRATYGYQTVAYVGSDGMWLGSNRALLQGFDRIVPGYSLAASREWVGSWLATRDPSRPFFLLLHSYEAHDPYGARNHPWPAEVPAQPLLADLPRDVALLTPRDKTRVFLLDAHVSARMDRRVFIRDVVKYMWQGFGEDPQRDEIAAELKAAYTEGARWVDGLLKDTVTTLEEAGVLGTSLLAVTSDHGEAFGEHGIIGHGRQLHREILHVPLVLSGPAPFAGGAKVQGRVSLVDVLPTFMAWAGFPLPSNIDGQSMLPVLQFGGQGRPVVSEEILSESNTGVPMEVYRAGVSSLRWKYVLSYDRMAGTVVESLYDVQRDPEEEHDLLRSAGPLPEDLESDFCEAVRALQQRLRRSALHDQQIARTPYGSHVASLDGLHLGVCADGLR